MCWYVHATMHVGTWHENNMLWCYIEIHCTLQLDYASGLAGPKRGRCLFSISINQRCIKCHQLLSRYWSSCHVSTDKILSCLYHINYWWGKHVLILCIKFVYVLAVNILCCLLCWTTMLTIYDCLEWLIPNLTTILTHTKQLCRCIFSEREWRKKKQ